MASPFLEPARHLFRLCARPRYREWTRLKRSLLSRPRYQEGKIRLGGFDVAYTDAASVVSAYEAIFFQEIYRFKSASDSPSILDLGANIGLSILYLKSLYPHAKITAFEADPKIFSVLRRNVEVNGLKDVTLLNQAAWDSAASLSFFSEGADGGRISSETDGKKIEVEAIDMSEFLRNKSFEFVKIDIEGAEERVLPAISKRLGGTRFLFVEYHSLANQPQTLPQLLSIMKDAGFRIYVRDEPSTWISSPFTKRASNCGFDLQLNLFGTRL